MLASPTKQLYMLIMEVKAGGVKERRMSGRKVQTTRADEGSRCSCTALRKASRRISQLYDAVLAPSGLKTTQRAILAQIIRSEPATVGALAEALVMDSGALAHTLKPLERDGLVAVDIDPNDRRNRLITLTAKGRAKLAETDALWAKAQRGFEIAFGGAESQALREALRLLVSDSFITTFESSLTYALANLRREHPQSEHPRCRGFS
jgi:DNA-binding MarR family transcriptional regulator